jgi:hypothetical protein
MANTSLTLKSYARALVQLAPDHALGKLTADRQRGISFAPHELAHEIAAALSELPAADAWSSAAQAQLLRRVQSFIPSGATRNSTSVTRATGNSTGSSLLALRLGTHTDLATVMKGSSVSRGRVVPEPDRPYTLEVDGPRGPHRFDVVFSPELSELLAQRGLQIDLDTAGVVLKDGTTQALLGPAAHTTPWLMTSHGELGLPNGTLRVALVDDAVTLSFDALATKREPQRAGVAYVTEVKFQGVTSSIEVRFTERAAQLMSEQMLWLDVDNAITMQGTKPLGSLMPATDYQEVTGQAPPAFLVQSKFDSFGLPKTVTVDLDVERSGGSDTLHWHADYDGLHAPNHFPFTPAHDFMLSRAQLDTTPMPSDAWHPTTVALSQSTTIAANDPALVAKATPIVNSVLGKMLARYDAKRANNEAQRSEMQTLIDSLRSDDGATPERLSLARTLANVTEQDAPHASDVIAALRARRASLASKAFEIVVVPKGKHFSALPIFGSAHAQAGYAKSDAIAANIRGNGVTQCFIPEEELDAPAAWISKHELHHLLQEMLDVVAPEVNAEVAEIFAATRKADGAMPREYSAIEVEFWTTCAELFEGRAGAPGVAWLKDKQPRIYELMCHATGRDPS